MSNLLITGDRVRYVVNGKKMRGVVADHLPFTPQRMVPIKKRKEIVWMDRKHVRKLPPKQPTTNT